jgi:ketosteroid isomerase-like protein
MTVAQRFFDAFALGDHHTMGQLYAPDATFSDPIFPLLSAEEVRLMWRMLLTRAQDFAVSATVDETPHGARAVWIARYRYGARPVRNRVYTEMAIAAGKIVRQVDRFSFWRWSRQALGWQGWLFGWTPWLRNRVRAQAAEALRRFAQRERLDSKEPQ